MGLFDFLKRKKEEPAPEPQTKRYITWVNISNKSIRTEVSDSDSGSYFKGCHIWEEDGKIRGFQGKDVLFEVSNKSKAYEELLPFVGKKLARIVIRKKTSEYGPYYMVSIAVDE